MPKILSSSNPGTFVFFCPGCECGHSITTKIWDYNNDPEKPTIRASVLVNGNRMCPTMPRCHSFVTDGKIQFLDDCDHVLKGQTVELPDFNNLDYHVS